MANPVCSIIIPTYRCLQFLPAALASVAAQGIDGVETLVLDDGSDDGTWEWLERRLADTPGLRMFRGGGMGPARARNMLINEAKSDVVAFLDADDSWSPGKLAAELSYHRANPDVALTFTDYVHVREDGRRSGTCFDFWRPEWIDRSSPAFQRLADPVDALLAANVVGTSCVVAKREALREAGGFSESLPSAEDWDLWLRLAENGAVAASPVVAMAYQMRSGSETAKRAARIAAMEAIVARYAGRAGRRALNAARARLLTARAEAARAEGRNFDSAAAAAGAFALTPSRRAARAAMSFLFDAVSGGVRR